MRVPIGQRLAFDVETERTGDNLYLYVTIRTDWGQIPIHVGIHADTVRGIAQWARSRFGATVYDFMVARKDAVLR